MHHRRAARDEHAIGGSIWAGLKLVARDLPSFQAFLTGELTSAPNVASVKTSLTIRTSKLLPGIPVDAA